jgi:hypothetical protein
MAQSAREGRLEWDHPDRVAGMDPEAREYLEERMKEIKVASVKLRRRVLCCGSCGNGEDRRVFERWLEDQ